MKELIKEMVESWSKNVDENRLELQSKLAKKIFDETNEGKLFLLNLPTGIGKTEIFLAPFLYQFRINEFFAGRMYIVEPNHALLRQIRDRIENYTRNIGEIVGEDHGDVENPSFLYTAPITLTTIDSFAYGFLAKRVNKWWQFGYETGRYTLPVGLMGNSYIVFDEAHLIQDSVFLSPRVMGKIICNLVNSGAIVIFSSATLPKALRERLTNECRNIKELNAENFTFKRNVKISFKKETLKDVECEGKTIIIVNTVKKARDLYKYLKQKCKNKKVYILHSLMTIEDKSRTYELLKNTKEDDVILIGTQTLEVGLDFSFNKLYTEISPIDSLIQRIGRVGRREENRSEAIIFDVENNLPYMDSLLKKTREILQENNGYEDLVSSIDKVYDEDEVRKIEEKGDLFYTQFLEYLENLHLFSYPPEDEVLIRPSNYITIFMIDDNTIISEKNDELVLRKEELVNKSLRYSISAIDSYSLNRLNKILENKSVYIHSGEEKDVIHVRKSKLNNRVNTIYIKRHGIYDDAGLIIEMGEEK
ncbi:CRISPR-associated helicase Cas3' [Saccharolobus shibatae]|uniref:CRISPR-associated helicase Cas3 n=1 Tax=Saccharolobus shibatae TaxID=2286 RepID=A0A8F5BVI0_9CREN|nr:CRISPR-associated helicase Cas3' [Saccharolobus shibatae]QXJ32140.1 CRISPR-associated helicase Cas3 [Saccharolobus shibatae]